MGRGIKSRRVASSHIRSRVGKRAGAAPDSASTSALPLLVAGVLADDVDLAPAAHDLAVLADPLDAGSNLHRTSYSLSQTNAESDPTPTPLPCPPIGRFGRVRTVASSVSSCGHTFRFWAELGQYTRRPALPQGGSLRGPAIWPFWPSRSKRTKNNAKAGQSRNSTVGQRPGTSVPGRVKRRLSGPFPWDFVTLMRRAEAGRFRDVRPLPLFASCRGRTSRPRLPTEGGQTRQVRDDRDDRAVFRVNGGGDHPQAADGREGLPDPDPSEVGPPLSRSRQPGVGGEGQDQRQQDDGRE
jgi:hypothetical protein